MSQQDSDKSKPVGRFARLMSATQKSSGDSDFTKKDTDSEPKTGGGGRGQLLRMAVSTIRTKIVLEQKQLHDKKNYVSHNYCCECEFEKK